MPERSPLLGQTSQQAFGPPEQMNYVPKLNEVMAERDRLREALPRLYREAPAAVARICDEFLDPSGRLLGEVRQEARRDD